MKFKFFISAIVIASLTTVSGGAFAQNPPDATVPINSPEAEKNNNIRQLLNITGASSISQQVTYQVINSLKGQYPQVPQEFWDNLQSEIKPDEIFNQIIPIYSRYYTNEEIKELIAFYQTPLGKKTINILPQLSRESVEVGIRYGQEAGQRALSRLEKEGYIPNSK
ncbi:DUF2059 domain-containing protein [Nostoc sp. UHCC 0302]|uniref:DUF2059 domain-containing protein n=1 Tax=Nostoc sp. UHCC 0302 TaxID=3134896 RepID=UPI00311C9E47